MYCLCVFNLSKYGNFVRHTHQKGCALIYINYEYLLDTIIYIYSIQSAASMTNFLRQFAYKHYLKIIIGGIEIKNLNGNRLADIL